MEFFSNSGAPGRDETMPLLSRGISPEVFAQRENISPVDLGSSRPPQPKGQSEFFSQASFNDKINDWAKAFEKISRKPKLTASEALFINIGQIFMNMLNDPLNPAHSELFQRLKTEYTSSGRGDDYSLAINLFEKTFLSLAKAESIAVDLRDVRRDIATVENLAPYMLLPKSQVDEKTLRDFNEARKNLESQDIITLKTKDKTGKIVEGRKPDAQHEFSYNQLYKYLSGVYLGNLNKVKNTLPYSNLDVLGAIDWISRNNGFIANRYFLPGLATTMNLRAQYELVTYTFPAMEKANLKQRGGRLTFEGEAILNQAIARLGFGAGTLDFSNVFGKTEPLDSSKLKQFIETYTKQSKIAPLIQIQDLNGNSIASGGATFDDTAKTITVGNMTIHTDTGKCDADGKTYELSSLVVFYPAVQDKLSSTKDNASMQILPSPKLDGFFRYGMPELVSKYPPYIIPDLVETINATMDSIQGLWSFNDGSMISDVSGVFTDIRAFNASLPKLLIPSSPKKVAEYEVKTNNKLSNFNAVTPAERLLIEQLQTNLWQYVQIPFVNVEIAGTETLKVHDGMYLQPTEEGFKRFLGDDGLQAVVDLPNRKVIIDKYGYGGAAMVAQQMINAAMGYGPEYKKQRLYFKAAGLDERYNQSAYSSSTQSYSSFSNQVGAFAYLGQNTTFQGNAAWRGANGKTTGGEFYLDARNVPFDNGTLREGTASGGFIDDGTRWLETYMNYQDKNRNNLAFYFTKTADNRYSLRIAARGLVRDKQSDAKTATDMAPPVGDWRELTVVENLLLKDVQTILQHFEYNAGNFGPTITARLNSNISGQNGLTLKDMADKDFTGLLVATNFGKDFGAAFIYDEQKGSTQLSDAVRGLLVSDWANESDTGFRFYSPQYDKRSIVSNFLDFDKSPGFFGESKPSGMFFGAASTQFAGEDKSSPNSIWVKYIVDDKFSIEGSVDRTRESGAANAYSFVTKLKGKREKKDRKSEYSTQVQSVLGDFPRMPYSVMAFGDQTVGATNFILNNEVTKNMNSNRQNYRNYVYLNFLYNTKGKLWDQAAGKENLGRSIGVQYENVLGWAKTSFKAAEQSSRLPGRENQGAAAIFTKKFDSGVYMDVQGISRHPPATDVNPYNREIDLLGVNVRKIKWGKSTVSLGAIAGKASFSGYTDSGWTFTDQTSVVGGGIRFSRKNPSLGEVLAALQGTSFHGVGYAGAAGFGINKPTRATYSVVSYRKENMGGKIGGMSGGPDFTNFNVSNFSRINRMGFFAYYDKETLTMYTTIAPKSITELLQSGGRLYYMSNNNMWRVFSEGSYKYKKTSDKDDEEFGRFGLGVSYVYSPINIPNKLVLHYLKSGELSLGYNMGRIGDNKRSYLDLMFTLRFGLP